MSAGVTEPYSRSPAPASTGIVRIVVVSVRAISCACSLVRACCFARTDSVCLISVMRASVACSASRRGTR